MPHERSLLILHQQILEKKEAPLTYVLPRHVDASGQIDIERFTQYLILGELSLDGMEACQGILAMSRVAFDLSRKALFYQKIAARTMD